MKGRLLLHVCCGPDGTVPWEELTAKGYEVTGYFYGSNIHPEEEYEKRKKAFLKLAEILNAEYEVNPYYPQEWVDRVRGLESEPEGGRRCLKCYYIQIYSAAEFAKANDFKYLATTLTISPHKDPDSINNIGFSIAAQWGLQWLPVVWRKGGGFQLSVKRSRELGLFRQNYCGCKYSIKRS